MRFKKGKIDNDSFMVIMHDLECLEIPMTESNKYHLEILKENLKDIFGRR